MRGRRKCEVHGADYLWLLVTEDEYEWPLVIADNLTEFSAIVGKSENAIRSAVCKAEKRNRWSRYRKVKK